MAQIVQTVGVPQPREQPRLIFSVYPANKGLGSGVRSAYLPPEALSSSINLIHDRTLARRTRPGISQWSSTAAGLGNLGEGPVQWISDFWRLDTDDNIKKQNTLVVSDNRIWKDQAEGNFSEIKTIAADHKNISGDALVGLQVIGVEDTGLFTYDQDTVVNITEAASDPAPNGWIVRQHRGAIWLAGIKETPDVIKRSNQESTSFTLGSSQSINLDLGTADRTGITAIFPEFLGRLYVAKENSLFEIDTTVASLPVRPVSSRLGCISHNAAVAVGGDLIFPSIRGLHSLKSTANYGDLEQRFISQPVSDIWDGDIDFRRSQEISATFVPEYDAYLMLYPKNDGKFNLLGYNINTGDFYLWPDYPATYITNHLCPKEKCRRLLLGDSIGRIARGRKLNDTNFLDLTDSYATSFSTPPLFPGRIPTGIFKFMYLTVFFSPRKGDITMSYTIDGSSAQTETIRQDNLTNNGSLAYSTVPINGTGTSIALEFSTTPAGPKEDAAMEILGYNIEVVPNGPDFRTAQQSV